MVKRLIVAAAASLAVLAAANVAGAANGKERVVVESFTESYAFSFDCADVGDYDFGILAEGTERVRVTEVVSAGGSLLQTVLDVVFRETNTNSVSGARLPLKRALHEVWDYASNTRTISGAVFIGTSPGGGTYVQDTGRITIPLDERIALFLAGPHEAFFAGLDPLLCAALAEQSA